MFLLPLLQKNPSFIEAVVELHQSGEIPTNSYALDLDAMAANTQTLMHHVKAYDLTVYAMTKQLGRAPAALDVITNAGVDGYVAVDMACARPIVANGHNLGHLGHLVQIPAAETSEAIEFKPDYWTVFSPNKANEVATAAKQLGRTQDLLVRVFAAGDEFYNGHEGGVHLDDLAAMIRHIQHLDGVRFAGLTTFPALLYDAMNGVARITANMKTLAQATDIAVKQVSGDQKLQINAPGTTSATVLPQLSEAGATQIEPGHGLTGTTPLHATQDLPEQPCVCYVSEVAHIHQGIPFCFGGGLYIDPVFGDYQPTAIVAHDPAEITTDPVAVDMPNPAAIDYYAKLHPESQRTIAEGATVVFGFRIQAFVTRAFVVGISGVRSGNAAVTAITDVFGNAFDWQGRR